MKTRNAKDFVHLQSVQKSPNSDVSGDAKIQKETLYRIEQKKYKEGGRGILPISIIISFIIPTLSTESLT